MKMTDTTPAGFILLSHDAVVHIDENDKLALAYRDGKTWHFVSGSVKEIVEMAK